MICPLIGLILIAIAAWLFVSGMKLRALAKNPLPACSNCGHLLHGDALRCNECGSQWTRDHLALLHAARQRSWKIRLGIALALAAVFFLAVIAVVVPLIGYVNRAKAANPPAQAPTAEVDRR